MSVEGLIRASVVSTLFIAGSAFAIATPAAENPVKPVAVQSTLANAEANHVSLTTGLPDKAEGIYQTVLANILATPLKLMAPLLAAHVQAGGDLVLAGILQRQADELIEAYAPWLALQTVDAEDGWILMSARRAD